MKSGDSSREASTSAATGTGNRVGERVCRTRSTDRRMSTTDPRAIAPITSADFEEVSADVVNGNDYRTYRMNTTTDVPQRLAAEYVRLRTATTVPLTAVVIEGIEVLDTDALQRLLARATTPVRRLRPAQLDIARSDFGELVAYTALRELFGTRFGWLALRDREVADQPARGVDLVGVEGATASLVIVLHETKVSGEDASPPGVVDSSPDCLRLRHLALIGDADRAASAIFDAARRANDPAVRERMLLAAFYVQLEDRVNCQMIASSLLARPEQLYRSTDFGTFRSAAQLYLPSQVRFLIVCVTEPLETVVEAWYQHVLRAGWEGP